MYWIQGSNVSVFSNCSLHAQEFKAFASIFIMLTMPIKNIIIGIEHDSGHTTHTMPMRRLSALSCKCTLSERPAIVREYVQPGHRVICVVPSDIFFFLLCTNVLEVYELPPCYLSLLHDVAPPHYMAPVRLLFQLQNAFRLQALARRPQKSTVIDQCSAHLPYDASFEG